MTDFAGTARFSVRQRLGSGGFGVVYRGFDLDRKLPVAIKTLKTLDPQSLARFKDEFRSLADIAHPNLITLFELLSDGDQWFFTMELVQGVDFLTWVRGAPTWARDSSDGRASEAVTTAAGALPSRASIGPAPVTPPPMVDFERLRDALRQLATGLDALHQHGTLHRDVKPPNVLVTGEGRVVLLDFGLARGMSEHAGETMAVESLVYGTPGYMAPERMRAGSGGPAADWYAVGAMLFEALTGRTPFTGSLVDQFLMQQQSPAPRPGDVVSGVPEDLDALCRDLLQYDPAARPAGPEVLARLGSAGPVRHAHAPTRSRTFVGRERELDLLDAAFDATLTGRPVVVRVHGLPGVGKSALVSRFLERLRDRRSGGAGEDRGASTPIVLSGRCYETESLPYKAVDSVLDALSRFLQEQPTDRAAALLPRDVGTLTRLFPVLGGVQAVARAERRSVEVLDAQELRRRAFVALRELFGRITDRQPLAIVIDDLQWGDLDSAALIAEVLKAPDPPAVLLIGTYRSEEAARAPMLGELARLLGQIPSLDVRDLTLSELSPGEARELASRLLSGRGESGAAGRSAEYVALESAGNPLFIGELARHQRRGTSDSNPQAGASLEQVIQERLSDLAADARRLLEVVALSGQPIDVSSAFRAAGETAADERLLAHLRSARLVRGSGEARWRRIEPYHDRIRQVVAATITPEAARACHVRIGDALENGPDVDPERLAFHFERAGEVDRAIPRLLQAAEHATAALAFDHAAALYQQVLTLRPPTDPAERRRLFEGLGRALASAGRGPKAAAAFLDAARDAPTGDALDLRRTAAHQLMISGHIDEGLDLLRSVLEAVGLRMAPTPKRALLSALYHQTRLRIRGVEFRRRAEADVPVEMLRRIEACWAVATGLANVDAVQAADFHARHLRLALDAGEPRRVARGLSNWVSQSAIPGTPSRKVTEALMAKADALVNEIGDPYAIGHNEITCGVAEFLGGRFRPAFVRLTRAEKILREQCTGVAWDLDATHLYLLRNMFLLGDIAGLSARVPRLIDEAQERGDRLGTTLLRSRILYTALLAADDPAAARAAAREGIASWSQRGFHQEHYFEWMSQVEADLYEGHGTSAIARVDATWKALQGSLLTRVQIVRAQTVDLRGRAASAAARATSDAGARDRWLKVAEQDARQLDRENAGYAHAFAHRLRASVAAVRGDTAAATQALLASERAFTDVDMALHAMATRRSRGTLIGGDEGRRLVQETDAWATSQKIRDPGRFLGVFGA